MHGGGRAGNGQQQRSVLYRWLKARRHALNRWGASYSRIPDDPVLDPAVFDWTTEVGRHWTEIRDEALAIFRRVDAIPPLRRISPDHRRIAADDDWRSFFLIGYGNEVPENIARAPRTYEIVRRIPRLNSAFFSILAPGAHIPRHRGVTKGIVTAHLGLRVPQDWQACTMRVADREVYWCEGEWTVFDDTCEHEVWNRTAEPRIVLLIQVARPLRWPASWVAGFGLAYLRRSPFVREARRELTRWNTAYREAESCVRGD